MADLTLDPKTTALILIDLQQGIVSLPLQPHAPAEVVRRSAELAGRVRGTGGLVVLVHVDMGTNAAGAPRGQVDEPMRRPGQADPDWAKFVPSIGPEPADLVITKRQWGAFHGTELDTQLRRRGIGTIVLGGIATNFGVESTARAAWEHGYDVILVEDAMSTMSAEMHAFAVKSIFPRLARVRSTAQVLAALIAPGRSVETAGGPR